MKRVVMIKVIHCLGCPNAGRDDNATRTVCQLAGRMIFWAGDEREEWESFIPDWCPLWNRQGKLYDSES